ncbi:hypothetical protein [Sphingobium sp. DC-2]|uniref:hypothetical protein n=1 Tax=Sphingobium sp. DC-2 TaxID=1303256 RepID=UPI0004C47657|nr:hypothetical protein [Sphingobium sp. DC-2]
MTLQTALFSNSVEPEANAAVADFASSRIWGEPGRFDRYCTLGVFQNEGLIAGVVYHNYDPQAGVVEMSAGAVSKRWLARPVLREMYSIAFDQLGCQAVIARHAEDRCDLRRMWKAVGAVEYVIPRLRGRNAPAEVVSILTEEAWKASPYMRH